MNNSLENVNSNNSGGTLSVPSSILRKCCACQKTTDRKDLIRILREHKTGNIIITPNSQQFGRSTYLCKNEECLKLAIKKKRLKNISENDLEKIKSLIKE